MPLPIAVGAGAIALAARGVLLGVVASIISALPQIFAKLLAGLGLYLVVGMPVAAAIQGLVQGQFGGLPGKALETMFYLNMDDYITAIISARAVAGARNVMLRKKPAGG